MANIYVQRLLLISMALSLSGGIGACSGADDDDSSGTPTATVNPGDDDASHGDDDATAGDDDATGGDDDATSGDDDASSGDDDATGGDDDDSTGSGELLITECTTLPPLGSGTCEVTAGTGGNLITGDILTPGEVLKGGQVFVDSAGKISCVACDCSAQAGTATRITCPTGVVSPGLINTHDHITFTQNDPYTDTGERYEQRHDWRKGIRGHTKISSSGSASNDQILWGELRFLMGGATSIVGSGGATGFLRNLDKSTQEGLNQPAVDFDTFPLGDSDGTQLSSGCDYPAINPETSIEADDSYEPHVSEGIDGVAHNEFLCLSTYDNGGQDLVQQQSAFIHSIGLLPSDYAEMAHDGTSLIWSPRSNITLYGDTAVVTEASRLGVDIALGTDWMPTGSMNLLRELKCADTLNQDYYNHYFTDEQLWLMVTRNAARVTATDDAIGVLKKGLTADISIFDGRTHALHRAVLDAQPSDVVMVMRGGKVLYGDSTLVKNVPNSGTCDVVDVCGVDKEICAQGEVGKSYSALKSSAGNIYAAFFCGTPTNEPVCTPERTWPTAAVNGSNLYDGKPTATDSDGDGIADSKDNCVQVFNPIRPVDNGAQADFDRDGTGDSCDPCPLNADTTECQTFDPNDSDGDGVANDKDNCAKVTNKDQADADADGKGDVCDPCPNDANPGSDGCPVSIYEIKDGTVPVGTVISLADVLVTGYSDSGFFVQTIEGDPDYQGSSYSGLFVYAKSAAVKVGDRVTIGSATIADFYGQIQLNNAVVAVDSSDNPLPDPVLVDNPADIATGGSLAAELESVLVEVVKLTVTDIAPPLGGGDKAPSNEFVVNGSLRVNDYLYLITPFPSVGENFASLIGVLELRNSDYKLEPRSADDVTAGSPTLLSFGPETSFARVGGEPGPTFPDALTVKLTRNVAVDTFVGVVSSDPTSLKVVGDGVTVPAGASSAQVQVEALVAAESVTLTAMLGEDSLTAAVQVLGADDEPLLVDLLPDVTTVSSGMSATFTVVLDIPAPPGGTEVTLALDPVDAGTVPASVLVPENALTAEFEYEDAGTATEATITAILGEDSLKASITLVKSTSDHLVINELDYDQINTDTGEFIEIYNGTGVAVDLSDLTLVFLNGSTSPAVEYDKEPRVDLAPAKSLPANGYLVVAASTVTVAEGALVIPFKAASDNIQNGAPDGVCIMRKSTGAIIDALSYEGSITAAKINGVTDPVNLVEGTVLPTTVADNNTDASLSLIRNPSGKDTNDAATDWTTTKTLTPGAANVKN